MDDGDTWRAVRPSDDTSDDWTAIDDMIPDAPWFWASLERFCVPGCCGLAAYDFSAASVAWACGWGTTRPDSNDWRSSDPGDPHELAASLRSAAHQVRRTDAEAVSAALFVDVLTPASYADLLDDLASKAVPR